MGVSRRFFLVGAGAVVTHSFIASAKAFVGDTGEPLLLAPSQRRLELYYEGLDEHWRLHLGTPQDVLPDPPLWIDHLRSQGCKLGTRGEIRAYCKSEFIDESALFAPLDGYAWEEHWELAGCPEAKAYQLLDRNHVLPHLSGFTLEGSIVFESFPNPISSAHWVEVHEPLSLSLLQARLNELDLGVTLTPFVRP